MTEPEIPWALLLAAYGLTFLVQNKMLFLQHLFGWDEEAEEVEGEETEESAEEEEPRIWRALWWLGEKISDLIHCTICMGFHTGWLLWLVSSAVGQALPSNLLAWVFPMFLTGLQSAVFSYGLDAFIKWAESNSR